MGGDAPEVAASSGEHLDCLRHFGSSLLPPSLPYLLDPRGVLISHLASQQLIGGGRVLPLAGALVVGDSNVVRPPSLLCLSYRGELHRFGRPPANRPVSGPDARIVSGLSPAPPGPPSAHDVASIRALYHTPAQFPVGSPVASAPDAAVGVMPGVGTASAPRAGSFNEQLMHSTLSELWEQRMSPR